MPQRGLIEEIFFFNTFLYFPIFLFSIMVWLA